MNTKPQPNDFVVVTCYARVSELGIANKGYWLQLPETRWFADVTTLPTISEEARQIINELYMRAYLPTWSLRRLLNMNEIPDPLSGKDKWSEALRELLALGIIEEMSDLACRYRLVIPKQAEVQG